MHTIGRLVGDALDHMAQVCLGVEAVELCTAHEAVDRRPHPIRRTGSSCAPAQRIAAPARRLRGLMHIVEAAARMRPARRLANAPTGIKRVEPGVRIGLQDSGKSLQVLLRTA